MSDLNDMKREFYQEKVDHIASRLRQMADHIERDGKIEPNAVHMPEASWCARKVIHTVMWGMANLDLDSLVLAAAEVDASTVD